MKNILLIIGLLSTITTFGQYDLQFKISGLKDTTVFLARYRGERLYYVDTTQSSGEVARFQKDDYEGGIYAVVCPGPKYFEFIMEDKEVEMETSMDDFVSNMKVKKSDNNKVFFDYMHFMKAKRGEQQKCKDDKECLTALNEEVRNHQMKTVEDNKHLLISKILKMSIDIEIPEEYRENDSLRYIYFKNHYWDNIDLSDHRLIHSPVFDKKLKFFYEKMLIQHPDTICANSTWLVDQIPPGTDMFMHVVHYITYKYETSKIMGMDGVFVCMGERYYCPEDSSGAFWLNEEKIKTLCERVQAQKPLLIGKQAPLLSLADTTEKNWVNFYNIKTKKTVLIFWADDCGHCKKEIPRLLDLYHELKEKNVDIEFVGIGTSLENDGWRKFIREKGLDWINVSDFQDTHDNAAKYIYEMRVTDLKSLNFRKTYDIFSTPQVYLLDENKVIEGKKLDSKNLANILEKTMDIELEFNDEKEEDKEKKEDKTH